MLRDPASGKTWAASVSGSVVTVRAGAPGKEKTSEKTFAEAQAARDHARAEEWTRLKKGFVLARSDAASGEALVHRFLARDYTGVMIAHDLGGRLLVNRHIDGAEQLIAIDPDGNEVFRVPTPESALAMAAVAHPDADVTLLTLDHQVLCFDAATKAFKPLSPPADAPGSFVDSAAGLGAWFADGAVTVTELSTGAVRFRFPVEPQLYSGHTPQMSGALSRDGRVLAVCAEAGRIRLFDAASGVETGVIAGDFEMLPEMAFGAGDTLFALERYGANALRCFDVATGAERDGSPIAKNLDRGGFALDPAGARLAILSRATVTIHDAQSFAPGLSFRLDHALRSAAIGFVGDALGVQTDIGCASLYRL